MAKIIKKEIVVKQATKEDPNGINPVSVVIGSKRLLDTTETSVSNKLAAIILTEVVIKELKDHLDNLTTQLETTSYDDITKALVDEGVLAPDETPVISVIDKKGNKVYAKDGSCIYKKKTKELVVVTASKGGQVVKISPKVKTCTKKVKKSTK